MAEKKERKTGPFGNWTTKHYRRPIEPRQGLAHVPASKHAKAP